MKIITRFMWIAILVTTLTACTAFAPKPTETPTPTVTSSPTPTSTPEPTLTPTPTATPTLTPAPPSATPDIPFLPMPSGTPMAEWDGIPIMPGAIAGEGDEAGYYFTVDASVDEVQEFYETEMPQAGWELLAAGEGGSNGAVMLIFIKGSTPMPVAIMPYEGLIYVMFAK
jgi:hypothetical protein